MHIFLSVRLFCTLSFEATVLSFQRKNQRAETKRKTKVTCTLRVPEYCCPKRRPAPKLEVRPVALPPWREAPGRQGRRFCEPQNHGLSFRSKILKKRAPAKLRRYDLKKFGFTFFLAPRPFERVRRHSAAASVVRLSLFTTDAASESRDRLRAMVSGEEEPSSVPRPKTVHGLWQGSTRKPQAKRA